MKIYKGKRIRNGESVPDVRVIVVTDGVEKSLFHQIKHSPTGVEWGYYGSGPSDLALSILWDFIGKEPERKLYMKFKEEFVSQWKDDWEISGEEIYSFLEWEAEAEISGA